MPVTLPLWDDLLTAALVGTGRKLFAPPAGADALGQLLGHLAAAKPERALLQALGVVALYQRAGQMPAENPAPLPEPSEPDDRPLCGPVAAQHLQLMLAGQYPDLLPEWLAAVAEAGRRVPPECLPALLDHGQMRPELRPAILAVIGQRGRWLARQNPNIDYAAVSERDPEKTWETGRAAARLAGLRQLRQTEPGRGLALLQSTWGQEKADDRVAYVAMLKTGLSLADEPFLEDLLDSDRSKYVRREAADMLANLPQSRLSRRLLEHARTLLHLVGSPAKLKVTLPQTGSEALERDGILAKPPSGKGEKTWLFQQLLSRVPPVFWSQTLNQTPAALLTLARATDWRKPLVESWVSAVCRHPDPAWAEALFWDVLDKETAASPGVLVDILPPKTQAALIFKVLEKYPSLEAGQPAHRLLEQFRTSWSLKLSRLVLTNVCAFIQADKNKYPWQMATWVKGLAYWLDPALLAEFAPRLTQAAAAHPHQWPEAIDQFLALWQFRHDLLKEIKQPKP